MYRSTLWCFNLRRPVKAWRGKKVWCASIYISINLFFLMIQRKSNKPWMHAVMQCVKSVLKIIRRRTCNLWANATMWLPLPPKEHKGVWKNPEVVPKAQNCVAWHLLWKRSWTASTESDINPEEPSHPQITRRATSTTYHEENCSTSKDLRRHHFSQLETAKVRFNNYDNSWSNQLGNFNTFVMGLGFLDT